jgi:hypothetical protein
MTDQDHPDIEALLTASKELLLEAMHDKTLPLTVRVEVAIQLINRWPDRHHYAPQPTVVIHIEGLGPNVPEVTVHQPDLLKVQLH